MKKHLSVFALMVRQNIFKFIILIFVSAVAQSIMFYLKFKKALAEYESFYGDIQMQSLESIFEKSRITIAFAATFVLLLLVLCTTCRSSSKAVYTLRRLRIGTKSIILWQTLSGMFYLFMLWAFELLLVLAFSSAYMKYSPEDSISIQTVFLAFYKNSFLHALLPLESIGTYIRNIVFIISLSVCSSVFSVYSLNGKISYEILVLSPLVILSFKRKLGEPTIDFLLGFYALFILGWCIFDIFKKEGGLNEEI